MGFRLLHFVILKRRPILLVTFLFFFVSLLYALIADRKYETKALLLPPFEEGGEGLLTAWMAQLNLPSVVIPATGGSTSAAILADIIESRRLGEMIVRTLGLKKRYDADTVEEAVGELHSRTRISVTKTGLIRLKVRDEEPEMAVRIARYYIEGLDTLNHYLQFTRAANTIGFISEQIVKYRQQLDAVREEISRFQHEYGIVDFEEQVRGAIDVAADIKVRTTITKIELDLLREFARRDAVELLRKEAEYQNYLQELNKIMEGDTAEAVFVPLRQLPELYQQYATMERDLEVNERVYSFLREQYEEAGIEKARNTPTVQVIDEPNLPEKPAGFPRWAIVIVSTAIGFVWSAVLVAWWGWVGMRTRDEDESNALSELIEIATNDLRRLRKLLRL
ncbi:MAG: hypothetical protein JSV33_14685 [bacterium]|nr:MAG: hypothetical protein JSV33_14685 [bacterium]